MSLSHSQNSVEKMVARGIEFSKIEGFIERLPLGDTHKAALWLLAWSYQDRPTQRRVAKEALATAAALAA
jgi:hypothetical protein